MRGSFFLLACLFFHTPPLFSEPASEPPKWRAELNESLDSIEKRISDMEAKTKSFTGSAQKEWQSTLNDLKKNRDQIRSDLKASHAAAKDKTKQYWKRIKAAIGKLEDGVNKAGAKLKEEN